jgi:hypothetical protein
MRPAMIAVAVLLVGCRERSAPRPALRGPLVPLVARAPSSLGGCDSVGRTYAVPFWRAPYRACRDTAGGRFQFLELDSDTVVTEVETSWRVPAARRAAEFAAAEAELTRLYGPGFRCSASRAVWRGPDSVRASLTMAPLTDVTRMMDSVPWSLRRYARLGPVLDASWCRTPGTPPP